MGESLLSRDGIRLGLTAGDRTEAIRQAGEILVDIGAVEPAYVDAMHEREAVLSSFVGEAFALPHGTDASRVHILRSALAFLQFPDGVDWDGNTVRICVAIAAKGDEHVTVLSALAQILMDPAQAERLRTSASVEAVYELLESIGKGLET